MSYPAPDIDPMKGLQVIINLHANTKSLLVTRVLLNTVYFMTDKLEMIESDYNSEISD